MFVLSVFGVWFFTFRPQVFGGPAQYVVVAGTSMAPTFKSGDVVVVRSHPTYHAGEVIAYRIPKGAPAAGGRIIHRIVGGSGASGYVMKGDSRKTADLWHPRVQRGDVLETFLFSSVLSVPSVVGPFGSGSAGLGPLSSFAAIPSVAAFRSVLYCDTTTLGDTWAESGLTDRQMCRLYLTMLDKLNVRLPKFGDATKALEEV